MPPRVTMRFNTTEVQAALKALGRKGRPAVARALNKSTDSGKTHMVRQVATDLALAVGTIRPYISTSKATPERLHVTFYASPQRIPLIEFKAKGPEPSRGRGKGVSAKLPTGAGRYPHAFIATVGSGRHRGVFQRHTGVGRKPIHELFGPSVAQSFSKHEQAAIDRCWEQLNKNLPHELEFALSKL